MRMKALYIKIITVLLGMILLTCSFELQVRADEKGIKTNGYQREKVKVGWYDLGEEGELGEEKNAHGYDYEYLQALSQYTNWEYEYVEGTWDECLQMLKDGDIDLLGFVSQTKERQSIYGYPELPMTVSQGLLVTSDKDEHITEASDDQLSGITVGVVAGNAYNEEFNKYCEKNGIKVEIKEYASLGDIPVALERGDVEAAVITDINKTENERILTSFSTKNQYYVTNLRNTELLDELNTAMGMLNAFCPDLNNDLYQKYFALNENGKPMFTTEEQTFIQSHPMIQVLYDAGWPPIEYYDEKTKDYKGISPDIFRLLTKKCGIEFVYEGSTSGDVLENLSKQEPENTITTISYDYHWADAHHVRITQPFISSTIVKIGKNLDAQKPVVAMNEKAYFSYLLKDELKNVKLLQCAKQIERFDAVASGKADYTYCTLDQANYYLTIPKYKNFKVQEMLGYEQQICVSISQNSDPALMSIISKSLASITHDEMTEIIRKNTEVLYKPNLLDVVYMYPVVCILCGVFLICIFAILFSRMVINKEKQIASERANHAKTIFLARMSHDMRTPLNGIIGMTRLALKTENLPEKAEDYMEKVSISGNYLMSLINDILDMSKIESGKMKISPVPATQEELLQSVIPISEQLAKEKDIEFTYQIIETDKSVLLIDTQHVGQILMNILSNAFKYTNTGGKVHLNVTVEEAEDNMMKATYVVTDNGVGMKREFQEDIFAPFSQENRVKTTSEESSGLGLAIVKKLVDLMHGKISLESELNEGSTFTITLCFKRTDRKSVEDVESVDETINPRLKGKRVLVFEDNALNAQITTVLLEDAGIIWELARNGQEGLEMYIERGDFYYDAILMDSQMPVMNGMDAAKNIRSLTRPDAKKVPIIALSANAFEEDIKMSLAAGMNDHLSKPLDAEKLYHLLDKLIL